MTELKPCPFCGGEAELWHNKAWDYVVRCTNKGCAARTRQYHENSNGAVDAWNTRMIDTCHREIESEAYICSECGGSLPGWMMNNYCHTCGRKVVYE